MPVSSDIGMLVAEIEANISHVDSITHGLSEEQFNWGPQPGQWSIGECLGHLNVVNGMDLAPLDAAIKSGLARGKKGEGPFEYGFLAKKFVSMMEPGTKKLRAPKAYLPAPHASKDATVALYKKTSLEMRAMALSADGLHLGKVKTDLPTMPAPLRMLYKMPLGARFLLIATHDRRHLAQAEQVRNHPDFPVFR